jgi:hypothetical protein
MRTATDRLGLGLYIFSNSNVLSFHATALFEEPQCEMGIEKQESLQDTLERSVLLGSMQQKRLHWTFE